MLQHAHGNKSEAARILGVDRKTLYRLLEAAEPAGDAGPGTPAGRP